MAKVIATSPVGEHVEEPPPEPQNNPVQISLGAKNRRVDVHGVPMPDRGPTGEGEDDRLPNMAHIDMYPLAPTFAPSDVSVPVEGGELTLEFRRTTGIRSYPHSDKPSKQPIVWSTDHILGLTWDTNICSRAIENDPMAPTQATTIRLVDEIGNSFTYRDEGELVAETFHSFANDAVRTRLRRIMLPGPGGTSVRGLELLKVHGTKLIYRMSATKQAFNRAYTENYYRLESVKDRNGNRLLFRYDDSVTTRDAHLLVRLIQEEAHPERKLQFEYRDFGDDPDTAEMGWRLTRVTDPRGRAHDYEYAALGAPAVGHQLLRAVLSPAVEDGSGVPGVLVRPTASFDYLLEDLPTDDPDIANRSGAPTLIRDARGQATAFTYTTEDFPIALERGGNVAVKYQKTHRVSTVTTVDGTARFDTLIRDEKRVKTTVHDTRGVLVTFDFISVAVLAKNVLGAAIYVAKLERETQGAGTAVFEWAPDPNNNLVRVTDLSGNVVEFAYGGPPTPSDPYSQPRYPTRPPNPIENPNHYQAFNKPSWRVVDPSGLVLRTGYRYETQFNKLTLQIDAEGRVTQFDIDAIGNRRAVREALGKTTTFDYDPDGFLHEQVDPDGRITRHQRTFDHADLDRYCSVRSTVVGYRGGPALDLANVTVNDVMGKTREALDAEGNLTRTEYDTLDRPTRVTLPAVEDPVNPAGPPVTSTAVTDYDLNGNVVREQDHNGHVTVYVVDLMNRVTEKRRRMANPAANDPADIVTRTTYNAVGLKETVTNPNGNVATFEYDELTRLSRELSPFVTLPNGSRTRYETRFEYGPNAGSGAFAYEGGWQATRMINRRGFATDKVFDRAYRLVREVRRRDDGAGRRSTSRPRWGEPTTEYRYDRGGNEVVRRVWNEDAAGRREPRTHYTYRDELYRVTVSVNAMSGAAPTAPVGTFVNDAWSYVGAVEDLIVRHAFDLAGHVISTTDEDDFTTDHEYDGAGRLIVTRQPEVEVFDPAGFNPSGRLRPTVKIEYDRRGNRLVVEDANHVQTRTSYDARGRIVQIVVDLNGDGVFNAAFNGPDIVTRNQYDLGGRLIRTLDSRGNAVQTFYDWNDRPIRVVHPQAPDAEAGSAFVSNEILTDYDANGNSVRVTDPRGVVAEAKYDELDRIRTVSVANGTPAEIRTETYYDANGNAEAHLLWNGSAAQITRSTYDAFDRKIREVLPDVGDGIVRAAVTRYYRNGNVRAIIDPNGNQVRREYDRDDRLIRSVHVDRAGQIEEVRTFAYDGSGNTLRAHDRQGATRMDYDELGRLRSERRQSLGELPYFVTSEYDAAGHRTRVRYPGTQREFVSVFDRKGRLSEVRDTARGTSRYAYDANGNRLGCTVPNGMTTEFTYDALNRVATLIARSPVGVVFEAMHHYDRVGNRRRVEETLDGSSRTITYDYDEQYRLTREEWAGRKYEYTYDAAGNRTSSRRTSGTVVDTTTYVYDALNRLVTATTGTVVTQYAYDRNGNLVLKSAPGGHQVEYRWDTSNRLVTADINRDTSPEFLARYDHRSRRISTVENGVVTSFRYDQGLCVQELQGGSLQVEFVRGSGLGGGIGSILYADRSASAGPEETFVYNPVGHTVALTDTAAHVVATHLYEAFGNVVASTGVSRNNRLAYTKERSRVLALDYHGMRYYDPETGRYVSRDPSGYKDGLNVYLHVRNNPVNHVDPLGLGFWDIVQGGLDVVSVIPVVGTATSLVNAGISVARGNYGEAALNLAGAIPAVGSVVKGASLGAKVVRGVVKVANAVNKVSDTVGRVETAVDLGNAVATGDVKTIAQVGLDAAVNRLGSGRGRGNRGSHDVPRAHGGGNEAHRTQVGDSGSPAGRPTPEPSSLERLRESSRRVREAEVKTDPPRNWRFQDPRNPNYKDDLAAEVPRLGSGTEWHADHGVAKGAAKEGDVPFVPVGWLEARPNMTLGGGEDKRAKRHVSEAMEGGDRAAAERRLLENLDRHLEQWRQHGPRR